MHGKVYAAFRDVGASQEKALKAAEALSRRADDVSSLGAELLLIKWMAGLVLAFQVGIFATLFL